MSTEYHDHVTRDMVTFLGIDVDDKRPVVPEHVRMCGDWILGHARMTNFIVTHWDSWDFFYVVTKKALPHPPFGQGAFIVAAIDHGFTAVRKYPGSRRAVLNISQDITPLTNIELMARFMGERFTGE